MLDYLEKQIIIDYHLRGEQAELEKEHPELAEIAKTYLGLELYYEVALKADGKPLLQDKAEYRTLIKMQEDLNKKF
jgi:hypothetical protein